MQAKHREWDETIMLSEDKSKIVETLGRLLA